MVAVIAEAVALVAVKEAILPVPLAAKPMAVLLFDQLNVAPVVPVNAGTLDEAPLQNVWFGGTVTVGKGLTVISKFCGVPGQLFKVGVTVTVEVMGEEPLFVAVNALMLLVPLAANPVLVLLFVQV